MTQVALSLRLNFPCFSNKSAVTDNLSSTAQVRGRLGQMFYELQLVCTSHQTSDCQTKGCCKEVFRLKKLIHFFIIILYRVL